MILERLPNGMFASNCYVIGDNGEGVVIDPGNDAKDICDTAKKNGLEIKYIIITHGHVDHIYFTKEVREKTGAKVLMHESDGAVMEDSTFGGLYFHGKGREIGKADSYIKDGDTLEVGGLKLEFIHTPGHTQGCVCIKIGNDLFTGDTLFRLSIGRTDLNGGDYEKIISSITTKLMKLDDAVVVHPGHGSPSTIGFERSKNPFIRDLI